MMKISSNTDFLPWLQASSKVLIKKLSRNDCLWADGRQYGHQNGVYIPRELRESGFFPALVSANAAKPHIFETSFVTFWPETGDTKTSSLKHYSNKGTEMHFTGVPRELFSGLTPASLIVGGRLGTPIGDAQHWFLTIDSASEAAEILESLLDLGADFHFGLFDPKELILAPENENETLIRELTENLAAGTLDQFIASVAKLPTSQKLADDAQTLYLAEAKLPSLDPFKIANPGDAIMRISRDIEYKLYKKAELRHRAAEVFKIISHSGSELAEAVVRGFPQLDATFLSASQHRKSRAGRSFERHIARLLSDGGIRYQEQAVTGGRRPDFVMPNLLVLKDPSRTFEEALILSAKTTLRERWKQLAMESSVANYSLRQSTTESPQTRSTT